MTQEQVESPRDQRRHTRQKSAREGEERHESERDCDRILYSSAYRRLTGVTQVVASSEIQLFHNRLTHTLKAAQIARRLAERFLRKPETQELAANLGGLDPSVAEAAAMAHDLGHPPFGHIAEAALNDECCQRGLDGFEGNAQTFRIVTKLTQRNSQNPGLNLTRATLNAILKYPWMRAAVPGRDKKFGAYTSEIDDLTFARLDFHDERR